MSTALRCLPGRASCPPAVQQALATYAARVHGDVDRGALAASLVGLQCVLEGFASVALQPPPGALARAADTLVPLRAFVLHQEQGHQRLGEVWAARLQADREALARTAGEYVQLAHGLLDAGLAQFDCLQEHRAFYRGAIAAQLRASQDVLRWAAPARAGESRASP